MAIAALLISHGLSFAINFIGKKEYKKTDIGRQMFTPYARIVLIHLTILFGGGISLVFQTPVFALVILIVLKTLLDITVHAREHHFFTQKIS